MRLVIAILSTTFACGSPSHTNPGPDGGGTDGSGGTDAGVCPSQSYRWATSGGGAGQDDVVTGVAADVDDNTWLIGTFIGSTTWGDITLSAVDTTHTSMFVAKLDPTGKLVFVRALQGGTGGLDNIDNVATRIRLDLTGNAFIAGTFENQLDVDNVHLTDDTGGNGEAFILELDPGGNAKAGVATTGGDGAIANDLALGASGDVYVTGSYNGSINFGSITPLAVSGDRAVFVAKYSMASATWQWADGWSGQSNNPDDGGFGNGVTFAFDGSIYAVGGINGTLAIDGKVLNADSGSFVTKLGASDGTVAWSTQITASNPGDLDTAVAAAADVTGVYLTGAFRATATLHAAASTATLALTTTSGDQDMFLVKYSPAGAPVWANHAGTAMPLITRGDDVAILAGSPVVGGYAQGQAQFGATALDGSSNMFVAKYDPMGTLQWVLGATDDNTAADSAEALALGGAPNGIVIGGTFTGPTSFGANTVTSSGEGDGFVARICN